MALQSQKKFKGSNNERASDFASGFGENYQKGAAVGGVLGGVASGIYGGFDKWLSQGAKRQGINRNRLRGRKQMEKERMSQGDIEQMVATGQGAAGAQQFASTLGQGPATTGAQHAQLREGTQAARNVGAEAASVAINQETARNAEARAGLSQKGNELFTKLQGVKSNPLAGGTAALTALSKDKDAIQSFRKWVAPGGNYFKA